MAVLGKNIVGQLIGDESQIHKTGKRLFKKRIFKIDSIQTHALVEIGKISAKNAIIDSKRLGLPITYLEDGKIYREMPNGTKEQIGQIVKRENLPSEKTVKIKKGTVLNVI